MVVTSAAQHEPAQHRAAKVSEREDDRLLVPKVVAEPDGGSRRILEDQRQVQPVAEVLFDVDLAHDRRKSGRRVLARVAHGCFAESRRLMASSMGMVMVRCWRSTH